MFKLMAIKIMVILGLKFWLIATMQHWGLMECFTLCMLGNFPVFLLSADCFKTNISNTWRFTIRVSKSLDPDEV